MTCKGVVTVGDVQGHRLRSGIVTGLALSDEPTFHNVFRLPVNKKVCQEIRSHFINKQRHPFWPFSFLTWCCALLLHKHIFLLSLSLPFQVEYSTGSLKTLVSWMRFYP